jgi:hypothetical protein
MNNLDAAQEWDYRGKTMGSILRSSRTQKHLHAPWPSVGADQKQEAIAPRWLSCGAF